MSSLSRGLDGETLDLVSSAKRRQKDLVEYQIPRLRSCKESLAVHQNLAAELREDTIIFARQIEVGISTRV